MKSLKEMEVPDDFEVETVIVLDRCTDNSEKIIDSFFKNDEFGKLKLKKIVKNWIKSDYGYPEAVNLGVENSKGEFIAILDADTIITKDWLKKILKNFKNQKIASVSGNLIPYKTNWIGSLMTWQSTISGTNRLYRKAVWDKFKGFKILETCDTMLDLEILNSKLKIIKDYKAESYDIREYTLKKIWSQGFRKGIGRYEIRQSIPYILGHGLKALILTPLGWLELSSNILGWISGLIMKKKRINMKLKSLEKKWEILMMKKANINKKDRLVLEF